MESVSSEGESSAISKSGVVDGSDDIGSGVEGAVDSKSSADIGSGNSTCSSGDSEDAEGGAAISGIGGGAGISGMGGGAGISGMGGGAGISGIGGGTIISGMGGGTIISGMGGGTATSGIGRGGGRSPIEGIGGAGNPSGVGNGGGGGKSVGGGNRGGGGVGFSSSSDTLRPTVLRLHPLQAFNVCCVCTSTPT